MAPGDRDSKRIETASLEFHARDDLLRRLGRKIRREKCLGEVLSPAFPPPVTSSLLAVITGSFFVTGSNSPTEEASPWRVARATLPGDTFVCSFVRVPCVYARPLTPWSHGAPRTRMNVPRTRGDRSSICYARNRCIIPTYLGVSVCVCACARASECGRVRVEDARVSLRCHLPLRINVRICRVAHACLSVCDESV